MKKAISKWLSVCLAATAMMSCSELVEEIGEVFSSEEKWTVEAANATKEGGDEETTRAIFKGGNTGKRYYSIWDTGDKVAVLKGNEKVGEMTPVTLGVAKSDLKGTLSGTFNVGDVLTLYVPGNTVSYEGQDGILGTVSSKYAFMTTTTKVSQVDADNKFVAMEHPLFAHQQAFLTLTFQDEFGNDLKADKLTISANSGKLLLSGTDHYGDLEVTSTEPQNSYFVAMRNDYQSGKDDITFTIQSGEDTYTQTKTVKFVPGKFYASTLAMHQVNNSVPLTLEAAEDNVTVTISNPLTKNLAYSTDDGATWTDFSSETSKEIVLANTGDKVCLHGDNLKLSDYASGGTNITCSGSTYIYGNIMSLLNSVTFPSQRILSAAYTFASLFKNNTNIKSHATKKLILPATTLQFGCYWGMFQGCTGLTEAPKLPARLLADNSYYSMFEGCTNLTNVPDLSAQTVTSNSCHSMFKGCTSLVSAPALPATELASSCYWEMFQGCKSLTSAPELPATTLAPYCYQYMFDGCTGLTTAPALPATALADHCYINMFQGCESLTSAPELPATTLAPCCYQYMFKGCTGLTTAPALPATTLANSCYQYMFNGCTSLTTAPALPATTLANQCYSNMFNGCTGLTTAPALPATTLADYCYSSMFNGCTSLTTAPALSATTLANSCYGGMFYGCTGLTTGPEVNVTTTASSCCSKMFMGCTNLVSLPITLSAMTLETFCYSEMFSGCEKLTTGPASLPATTLARNCYKSMFNGCKSLTKSPILAKAETLAADCYSSMFSGCSNLATITCLNTTTTSSYYSSWVSGVASSGTFYKAEGATWPNGTIPSSWTQEVYSGGE